MSFSRIKQLKRFPIPAKPSSVGMLGLVKGNPTMLTLRVLLLRRDSCKFCRMPLIAGGLTISSLAISRANFNTGRLKRPLSRILLPLFDEFLGAPNLVKFERLRPVSKAPRVMLRLLKLRISLTSARAKVKLTQVQVTVAGSAKLLKTLVRVALLRLLALKNPKGAVRVRILNPSLRFVWLSGHPNPGLPQLEPSAQPSKRDESFLEMLSCQIPRKIFKFCRKSGLRLRSMLR